MAYIKGSKKNPYTSIELSNVNTNSWHGGWAVTIAGDLYFYDREFNTYSAEDYGRRNTPFPRNLYSEMREYGLWAGGYTFSESDLVYITAPNIIYRENDRPFGHIDDPCPYDVFEG